MVCAVVLDKEDVLVDMLTLTHGGSRMTAEEFLE
jgi:hypothetical protein